MKFKFKNLQYIFFFALYVSSCKDSNEYRVGEDFQKYVASFTVEAAKRDYITNFEEKGLIIEFADLKNNQAGLCHYEKPIRIEIDKTYWNTISKYVGDSLMKENLIFHELGHGILGRDHLNSILENGDWKSMMCGGEKVNNRSWNINYRGFRRDYYISELFNESIVADDNFRNVLAVDTSGFVNQYYQSFYTNNKSDNVWGSADNDSYKLSIDNARLKFESKIDVSFIILTETSVDNLSDFSFDIDIECQASSDTGASGIVFGYNNILNDALEFFTINANQNMYVGNRLYYSYYIELTKTMINKNGVNNLKIIKKNGMLYYFINNKYVYCSENELSLNGNQFGFIVAPSATLWLNNMKIGTNSSSKLTPNKIISTNPSIQILKKNMNQNIFIKQ